MRTMAARRIDNQRSGLEMNLKALMKSVIRFTMKPCNFTLHIYFRNKKAMSMQLLKAQGPVVKGWFSAIPGLKFNPLF